MGRSVVLRLLKSALDTIAENGPVLLGGETEIETEDAWIIPTFNCVM